MHVTSTSPVVLKTSHLDRIPIKIVFRDGWLFQADCHGIILKPVLRVNHCAHPYIYIYIYSIVYDVYDLS